MHFKKHFRNCPKSLDELSITLFAFIISDLIKKNQIMTLTNQFPNDVIFPTNQATKLDNLLRQTLTWMYLHV